MTENKIFLIHPMPDIIIYSHSPIHSPMAVSGVMVSCHGRRPNQHNFINTTVVVSQNVEFFRQERPSYLYLKYKYSVKTFSGL